MIRAMAAICKIKEKLDRLLMHESGSQAVRCSDKKKNDSHDDSTDKEKNDSHLDSINKKKNENEND